MNATPDMMVAGLKMVAALGVVLVILFALLYVMRKFVGSRMGTVEGKRIQVLESHYMGVKKSISLIRVPGKVLVVGVTNERINLLDTLDESFVEQYVVSDMPKPFGLMLMDRLKKKNSGFKEKEKL